MWNWNLWCWICFHQRRCAARKRVIFNETHFVTEFGQHIVTNVNLCSLHVNIIPSRITSGTTMPTEAQKLCTTSFQSRTAGRDSSKPWGQERVGIEYCKLLWWLYLYLLREVNRDLTAPASITSCNSVMSHRDTTCRGSDTKHYIESENHPRKRNEPARCNNTFSSQCVRLCVCETEEEWVCAVLPLSECVPLWNLKPSLSPVFAHCTHRSWTLKPSQLQEQRGWGGGEGDEGSATSWSVWRTKNRHTFNHRQRWISQALVSTV